MYIYVCVSIFKSKLYEQSYNLTRDVSITIWWCCVFMCVWPPFFHIKALMLHLVCRFHCLFWVFWKADERDWVWYLFHIENDEEKEVWEGLDVDIEWHGARTTIQTWIERYDGINDVIVERHSEWPTRYIACNIHSQWTFYGKGYTINMVTFVCVPNYMPLTVDWNINLLDLWTDPHKFTNSMYHISSFVVSESYFDIHATKFNFVTLTLISFVVIG